MAERLLSHREARGYLDGKIGPLDPHTVLAELRRKDRDYRPELTRPGIYQTGGRVYYRREDLDRLVTEIRHSRHPIIDGPTLRPTPALKPAPAGKAELHLPDGTIISLTAETARKIADAVIKKATGAVH